MLTSMPRKEDGIEARNRDFARYEQVDKKQDYRLAEANDSQAAEEFDDEFRIRTCDLGRWMHGGEAERRGFADELGRALEEIGFAILEGHGVDRALHEEADARTRELFTATPLADKLRFRAHRHGSVNQGYFPIQETSNIHP